MGVIHPAWFYQNHPKILALNLPAPADFGYLKDLPEIMYRILEGQQMEREKNRVWRKRIQRGTKRKTEERSEISNDQIKGRASRKEREMEKAKRALQRYHSDANYKLLFDKIADLFVELLKSDLKCLNSNELNKIGLASKLCPSVDSSQIPGICHVLNFLLTLAFICIGFWACN